MGVRLVVEGSGRMVRRGGSAEQLTARCDGHMRRQTDRQGGATSRRRKIMVWAGAREVGQK